MNIPQSILDKTKKNIHRQDNGPLGILWKKNQISAYYKTLTVLSLTNPFSANVFDELKMRPYRSIRGSMSVRSLINCFSATTELESSTVRANVLFPPTILINN